MFNNKHAMNVKEFNQSNFTQKKNIENITKTQKYSKDLKDKKKRNQNIKTTLYMKFQKNKILI